MNNLDKVGISYSIDGGSINIAQELLIHSVVIGRSSFLVYCLSLRAKQSIALDLRRSPSHEHGRHSNAFHLGLTVDMYPLVSGDGCCRSK